MVKYEFNRNEFEWAEEFYDIIQKKMNLPDWFGKNASVYQKNGEIFADVKANEKAIVYWCLQYGEHVELLSPQPIREKIKSAIGNMAKRYR